VLIGTPHFSQVDGFIKRFSPRIIELHSKHTVVDLIPRKTEITINDKNNSKTLPLTPNTNSRVPNAKCAVITEKRKIKSLFFGFLLIWIAIANPDASSTEIKKYNQNIPTCSNSLVPQHITPGISGQNGRYAPILIRLHALVMCYLWSIHFPPSQNMALHLGSTGHIFY